MRYFTLLVMLCAALAPYSYAADYFGTKSREFALTGSTVIDVPAALVKRLGEDKAVAKALEDADRYFHLIHFTSAYFIAHNLDGFARGSSFETERIEKLADGRYRVDFHGLMGGRTDLVDQMTAKGLFRSGHRILVSMPVHPEKLSDEDWYDFEPESFKGDMVQFPVSIRPLPAESGDTYPDYRRLFEDGVLTISIFYGYDGPDPEDGPGGNDLQVAKAFYEKITQEAHRLQFSDPVHEHFGKIRNSTTFTRTMQVDMGDGPKPVEIRLKLFYRNSPKVMYHFRQELKTADVLIYDGHSNYGEGFELSGSLFFSSPEDAQALDGEMVRERTPDRYQIFFMNACSSYGYYPDMFYQTLSRKNTGNLDVITTINTADFADSVKTDAKLVNLLTALVPHTREPLHQARSWSEIVASLNAGLTAPTYYAVHGIADNPRQPYGAGAAPAAKSGKLRRPDRFRRRSAK